jgi:hypothetical protein
MKQLNYIVITFALAVILISCQKIEHYSSQPVLTYDSQNVTSTQDALGNSVVKVSLTFGFVDGNGDLIVSGADSLSAYSHLYIYIYARTNGKYALTPTDSVIYWLKYSDIMNRDGNNKTFKGTMTYNHYFYSPITSDTVKFSCYVIDYELNKSNILEFLDISLK